ncbi:GyrI-like domain-containing protein [Enterovirga sp.]|uniref:GyrI-like domain-containing protein n=1 Tax=Enterovirga sp. TaxID=2026350 RepID=UPI002B9837DD|nr:GyrI-like domain-containing protein [Enterovirga sp.]HMO30766.1 GyrI-like domain-containing protein [Enterovirga sp.]
MSASRRTFVVAACAVAAASLAPTWLLAQESASPAPASPAPSSRPTLLPEAGDPANMDEVMLVSKPVLILSGTSDWDNGLKNLRAAFASLESELARLGIAPAGRPLALYTQPTDDNFKFDAMIPIAAPPATPPADLAKDMRFGETPSGKAFRFVHKGAYDDIDSTYETITTYLEAKDIVARDAFMEEFVNDVADPADETMEVNIFVQPK